MSKELDDLTAEVAAESTVEASACTLIAGLAAQITAAGTDPSKLRALTASIKSSSDALAAAVAAGTPTSPVGAPSVASIGSISPNAGGVVGGTSVTVTGTGFQTGCTVSFGGHSGSGTTFNSSTSVTSTTPALSAGTVDVLVTNPDGSKGTLAGSFTYA